MPSDHAAALAELAGADPKLGRWMAHVGPLSMPAPTSFQLVDALARSILYQQLHGKAAATIVGRVEAALGQRRITAAGLAAIDPQRLREAGVSGAKAASLKDLASHAIGRRLPAVRRLHGMDDARIIEALTQVRGIGPWTAHMLLIFRLGRADVLPETDYGVRAGAQKVHGLERLPSQSELREMAEAWRPHRSLASLYLWKAVDLARESASA